MEVERRETPNEFRDCIIFSAEFPAADEDKIIVILAPFATYYHLFDIMCYITKISFDRQIVKDG